MKKFLAIVLTVLMLASFMLPVSAGNNGEIRTDKTEYLEGEMVHVYFEFPTADSERQIWVYQGEVKRENRVWVISATGTENHGLHPIFWHDLQTSMATPGEYTMVVTNKTTEEAYSPMITSTFTIKANPNLTRTPTISLDKDTYGLDDIMIVSYNGITDALPFDKILQITLYDDMDFPATSEPIYLWDTREYIGISGTLEIDLSELDLWEGDFYAVIESNDESMDLSYSRVDFKIAEENVVTETTEPGAVTTVSPELPTETPTDDMSDSTETNNSEPTSVPTQNPNPDEAADNNAMLYVLGGIAVVLGIALGVTVVLLVKKKK